MEDGSLLLSFTILYTFKKISCQFYSWGFPPNLMPLFWESVMKRAESESQFPSSPARGMWASSYTAHMSYFTQNLAHNECLTHGVSSSFPSVPSALPRTQLTCDPHSPFQYRLPFLNSPTERIWLIYLNILGSENYWHVFPSNAIHVWKRNDKFIHRSGS